MERGQSDPLLTCRSLSGVGLWSVRGEGEEGEEGGREEEREGGREGGNEEKREGGMERGRNGERKGRMDGMEKRRERVGGKGWGGREE